MSKARKLRGKRQPSLREAFEASAWNLLRESILPLLEKEDEEHLNVFHYAIKSNNVEAVEYFLTLDTLNSKDHSPTVPYFHYAAYTGNVEVLKLFGSIQGAYCHLPISFGRDIFLDEFPKMDQKLKHFSLRDYTPLDIAAACSDWNTVDYLLKDKRKDNTEFRLETAANLGSPECVRYLLEREPDIVDITVAFCAAFEKRMPNCMQLLFEKIPPKENLFQDFNPFHILYNHTRESRPDVPRGQGLLDCTEWLLRVGFSVEYPAPQGAYPLYTLIEKMFHDKERERVEDIGYHIKCLKLLLEAGANPNFEEGRQSVREYSTDDEDDNERYRQYYIGRDNYCNFSFEALLDNEDSNGVTKWDCDMEEFLTGVFQILIQYGANLQGCGDAKSALYYLFEKMASRHLKGSYFVPHQTISLLMRHSCHLWDSGNSGIDFDIIDQDHELKDDVKKASGPFGIYFGVIFRSNRWHNDSTEIEKWCESDACYNLGRYFSMMNVEDGRKLLTCILKVARFYNNSSKFDNEEAMMFIEETLSQFLNRNLFTHSSLVIRKCMGENWYRLEELKLPVIVTERMKGLLPP